MDSLFFSYSHKDEVLRDRLETQLTMLKRQGVISTWHDRRLLAGDRVDDGIDNQLENAHIVLLLVSPDFLASEYCYGREMNRALERNKGGEARVIPVILRPCEWKHAPFGELLAAPKDGIPVTRWPDLDEAFLDIASAIRNAARQLDSRAVPRAVQKDQSVSRNVFPKAFTERDHERFAAAAYESIARFFENSLDELSEQNVGIGVVFKRTDAKCFTASMTRNGVLLGRCVVRLGHLDGVHEITLSRGADVSSTSYHERLSLEAGAKGLFLKAALNAMLRGTTTRAEALTPEVAAEYYWQLFVVPIFEVTPLSGLDAPGRTDSKPQTENVMSGPDLLAATVKAPRQAVPEHFLPNLQPPASETRIATLGTGKGDLPLEGPPEGLYEVPSTAVEVLEPASGITEPRPSVIPERALADGVPDVSPALEHDHALFGEAETAGALYDLGMRLELGLGMPPDTAKARECYIRAARKGQNGAMNSLGLLYEQGEGVIAPNLEKAHIWFRLAVRHNSKEARENLRRFEN